MVNWSTGCWRKCRRFQSVLHNLWEYCVINNDPWIDGSLVHGKFFNVICNVCESVTDIEINSGVIRPGGTLEVTCTNGWLSNSQLVTTIFCTLMVPLVVGPLVLGPLIFLDPDTINVQSNNNVQSGINVQKHDCCVLFSGTARFTLKFRGSWDIEVFIVCKKT